MDKIEGVIKQKTIKKMQFGDLLIFNVNGQSMSVFANDKKLSGEANSLLRELQQGDYAEFTVVENTGKDGKTYKNIVGVERVTQMREPDNTDTRESDPRPKSNQSDGDTKIRSMALAYAKDIAVAQLNKDMPWDKEDLMGWAKRFEQYIQTGE